MSLKTLKAGMSEFAAGSGGSGTLVPPGGLTGEALLKASNADGDTVWAPTGDVVGPASATDNAIARYDSTTGKRLQNSAATIDDSGVGTFAGIIGGAGTSWLNNAVLYTDSNRVIVGGPLIFNDGSAFGSTFTAFVATANTAALRNGSAEQEFRLGPSGSYVAIRSASGILQGQDFGGSFRPFAYVGGSGIVISGNYTATGTATTTFTVTIGVTMANATYEVVTEGNNALSSAVHYVNNKTTTTFDVVYLAGLTGAVAFDWIVSP